MLVCGKRQSPMRWAVTADSATPRAAAVSSNRFTMIAP